MCCFAFNVSMYILNFNKCKVDDIMTFFITRIITLILIRCSIRNECLPQVDQIEDLGFTTLVRYFYHLVPIYVELITCKYALRI